MPLYGRCPTSEALWPAPTIPKPLRTLWSRAALEQAGDALPQLQRQLNQDFADVMAGAYDWFRHVLRQEEPVVYLCTGQEEESFWRVHVQLAGYRPLPPLPEDHPDPARRGKVFKFAEALDIAGNEEFAEVKWID
jgi:hypothetical protein